MQRAHAVPSEVQATAGSLWNVSDDWAGRLFWLQVIPPSPEKYCAIVVPLLALELATICSELPGSMAMSDSL